VGGKWDPLHQFVGSSAVEQLSRYRVDKVFLGVPGLDPKLGLTGPSEEEAALKRTILQMAQRVVALADHSKIGQVMFAHVAPSCRVDVLVTDGLADLGGFEGLNWKVLRVRLQGIAA